MHRQVRGLHSRQKSVALRQSHASECGDDDGNHHQHKPTDFCTGNHEETPQQTASSLYSLHQGHGTPLWRHPAPHWRHALSVQLTNSPEEVHRRGDSALFSGEGNGIRMVRERQIISRNQLMNNACLVHRPVHKRGAAIDQVTRHRPEVAAVARDRTVVPHHKVLTFG
jgi:hypothetical protein